MSRFESIANHALAVHRDDVIDEITDWLETSEGEAAYDQAHGPAGLACLIQERFGRG